MQRSGRIRLARRRAGLSQQALANAVGVRRSAVANWEGTNEVGPSGNNLQRLACVLQVAHEWLATGRGDLTLPECGSEPAWMKDKPAKSVPERRLLRAWRALPAKIQVAALELLEGFSTKKNSGR